MKIDDISNKVKEASKKIVTKAKNAYEKVKEEIRYVNDANCMYIIKTPKKEKINKLIFAIFDLDNQVLYVKKSDIFNRLNYIEKQTLIKDSKDNVYEVTYVDKTKTYDFLSKNKKGYSTISCYKVKLIKK